MHIYPQRIERFKEVIRSRQYDLTVVLENVHDPHNIGAVLRSCDSIGISEVYIIYTDPLLIKRGLDIGLRSSSGALQWIDIHYFNDVGQAFKEIKAKYDLVFGTVIGDRSRMLYDLTLTESIALFFGNEHSGISKESQRYIDVNFVIPQHGFVQSLNISVACAVALYEAQRQRQCSGKYERNFGDDRRDNELLKRYIGIHESKKLTKKDKRINL